MSRARHEVRITWNEYELLYAVSGDGDVELANATGENGIVLGDDAEALLVAAGAKLDDLEELAVERAAEMDEDAQVDADERDDDLQREWCSL